MPAPWLLPAAGVAAGLLGQLHANATNVRLAREQMRFQERMSSSAHQRGRGDLEAAGYNPMLGVGGPGASSAVGTSARVENAPGAGLHSGLAVKQAQAPIELLKAQTGKTTVEGFKTQQELHDLQANPESSNLQPAGYGALQRARLHKLDADTVATLLPLVAAHKSAETARNVASALETRDHAALLRIETVLKQFQVNEFRNMSEAQKTWWMREVAPFLHSARDVVGVAGQVATPLAIGRGAKAIGGRPLDVKGLERFRAPATGTLYRDPRTGKVIGRESGAAYGRPKT